MIHAGDFQPRGPREKKEIENVFGHSRALGSKRHLYICTKHSLAVRHA